MDSILDCEIYRRFGAELEVNTPSGEIKKLSKNEAPEGATYIAELINKITKERVDIHGWHSTHDNNCWVIKPDSSCGVEICSPILKGWTGLKSLLQVVDGMKYSVKSDRRCSFHLHVNMEDMESEQIGTVLAWWIKCESVFMDAMPEHRKLNRYCQHIGVCEIFEAERDYCPIRIMELLSDPKYFTVNTFHLMKGKRKTIEYRTMGSEACRHAYSTKCWVRLLLHFVETAYKNEFPASYVEGNPWTSLCWLDPIDVFNFLGFNDPRYLSPGLKQVRSWFLYRLMANSRSSNLPGIWSSKGRKVAIDQIETLFDNESLPAPEIMLEELYSDRYVI